MATDPIQRANRLGYQCRQIGEDAWKVEGQLPMSLQELLDWLDRQENRKLSR